MKFRSILFFLFCVIVGLLISIQSRIITGTFLYVSPKVIQDYDASIKSEKTEIEKLKTLINEKEEKIKEYEAISGKGDDIVVSIQQELDRLKLMSGYKDVQGEGALIILDDGTRELYEYEDPNDIIVHDIDLLMILNDLKIAGVEAISINGQRVINNTEVNCSGHSVRINNQFFAQPFIIKAVGDPVIIESALSAPGTYGELLREYGLILDIYKSINIRIPKYSETVDYKFLKTIEEGEV